jgi:DNA-directed RNA polymerase specialized sigma24 family protein
VTVDDEVYLDDIDDEEPQVREPLSADAAARLEAVLRDAQAAGDRRTAEVLRLWLSGFGVNAIARRLRVSRGVVCRALARAKSAESETEKSTQRAPGPADGLR